MEKESNDDNDHGADVHTSVHVLKTSTRYNVNASGPQQGMRPIFI